MSKFDERLCRTLGSILSEEETREPGVSKPDCCLSKEQIDEHYDKHYKGYLKGFTEAKRKLKETPLSDLSSYRSAMLDLSFNYNGIVLHEHYFACLGHQKMSQEVSKLVNRTFGSQKKLEDHLKSALMASRGWVVLGHDLKSNELLLNVIDDHDIHCMLAHPILVLDVWEHAYYIDHRSNKEKYADLIIPDINWEAVEERILRIEDGHSISRITV